MDLILLVIFHCMLIKAKQTCIAINTYAYTYLARTFFIFWSFYVSPFWKMHLFQLKDKNEKFLVQGTHLSALGMFFWSVNRMVFFLVILFPAVMTCMLCYRCNTFMDKADYALCQKGCMALKAEILKTIK